MRKDIFIDAQIAYTFASKGNDPLYGEFIKWLLFEDKANTDNNAHLVSSKYLVKEYWQQNSDKEYCIKHIWLELQRQDRINTIPHELIESFKSEYFTKKAWDKLNCKGCNTEDPNHLVIVLLSDRRMALIEDDAFITDLINFRKFGSTVKAQKELTADFDYKTYSPQLEEIPFKKK